MAAVLFIAVSGLGACADARTGRSFSARLNDDALAELSAPLLKRIGDGVGEAHEARFLGSSHVLVLDEYAPYLRLFSLAGDPLWSGATDGGGPRELNAPQALATRGDDVFVVQPGRISHWRLEADSLAFVEPISLPLEYFPFGLESGCNEGLLLYARNGRQFRLPPDSLSMVPRLEYLHSAIISDGNVNIWPLWGMERALDMVEVMGHEGVLINRTADQIVVLHRMNFKQAGQIIEFDCNGNVIRKFPELELVRGDSIPVQVSRSSALEWTSGLAAIPDGFVIGIDKYFSRFVHGVDESFWTTEVFRFSGGRFRGSTLLQGQWRIMDYLPDVGLLMTGESLIPHFVVVPDAWITGGLTDSGGSL